MEYLFWTVFFKPFVAVVFFLAAWAIAALLKRYIPEGKVKRILYSPPFWMQGKGGRG